MPKDQYTLTDPTKLYADIDTKKQTQPSPGLDAKLRDRADLGEDTYRGHRPADRPQGADHRRGLRDRRGHGDRVRPGGRRRRDLLPESEESDAQRIIELINDAGRKALPLPGDLTDPTYCRNLVAQAVEGLGGLDILVNNAAEQTHVDSLADLTDEQFDLTMKANIYATFWVTKAALPHLKPGSTIINTSSKQAYEPSPGLVDYATTKAAINTFSKALAQQLAPKGIRVNVVAPGPVWTPLQTAGGQPPDKLPEFGENTPLGRPAQPAEMAPAFVFLASPESSYVVGETLNANGGTPTP